LEGVDEELEEGLAEEQEVLAQAIEDEQIAESSLEGVDEELEEELVGVEDVSKPEFLEEEFPLQEQAVQIEEEMPKEVFDEHLLEEKVTIEEQAFSSKTEDAILEEEEKEELELISDLEIIIEEDEFLEDGIIKEDVIVEEDEAFEEEAVEDAVIYEEVISEGVATEKELILAEKVTEEAVDEEIVLEEKLFEDEYVEKIVKEELPEEEEKLSFEQVFPFAQEEEEDLSVKEESVFDETIQEQIDIQSFIGDRFSILRWLQEKLDKCIFKFSYYTQKIIIDFFKNIFVQIALFVKGIGFKVGGHFKSYKISYIVLLGFLISLAFCWRIILKTINRKKEEEKIIKLFPKRVLTKEEKKVANFYLHVLQVLEKIGYKRLPYLTPREFAQKLLVKGFKISKDFLYLTDMFYKISFGHMKVESVELQKIHNISEGIKEWAKEMQH
ncbi:MAG: DUF4129 domain-containing protein, partial [Candidatus Saelkia tenebricola]|nr:DUF4129 domain-containing protein [Candidatus Saelkia tenebricola]